MGAALPGRWENFMFYSGERHTTVGGLRGCTQTSSDLLGYPCSHLYIFKGARRGWRKRWTHHTYKTTPESLTVKNEQHVQIKRWTTQNSQLSWHPFSSQETRLPIAACILVNPEYPSHWSWDLCIVLLNTQSGLAYFAYSVLTCAQKGCSFFSLPGTFVSTMKPQMQTNGHSHLSCCRIFKLLSK